MDIFEAVKQSVTTKQAAKHYGIYVNRNGMCVCPFHNDKNPSMKADLRFYCFGCGATGDVIDFVSRLLPFNNQSNRKIKEKYKITQPPDKNCLQDFLKPVAGLRCRFFLSGYFHVRRTTAYGE